MKITSIRFSGVQKDEFVSYVAVVFDDKFIVTGLKIIRRRESPSRMLAMPSRKRPDDTYADVAHPITPEFRRELEREVFKAYDAQHTAPAAVAR